MELSEKCLANSALYGLRVQVTGADKFIYLFLIGLSVMKIQLFFFILW